MTTKAEREHLSRVAEIGCIVCLNENLGQSPAEIHHIRSGKGMGQRASNYEAIPLCPAHHRNGGHGIAFHAGPRVWQERYGSEELLLNQVKEILQ